MKLNRQILLTIIENTPLVSIDLVIQNDSDEILLGLRNNRPAQNTWFVPGGRINKNERVEDAFKRITLHELNRELELSEARFLGVFQHIYPDNFSGEGDFGTHYVVLAFSLKLPFDLDNLPEEQHQAYRWWAVDELLKSDQVHENTQAYFRLDSRPASLIALSQKEEG